MFSRRLIGFTENFNKVRWLNRMSLRKRKKALRIVAGGIALAVALTTLLYYVGFVFEGNNQQYQDDFNLEQVVEQQIRSMTLEEKVGQLFMVGFSGQTISKDLESFLIDRYGGGLIIYGHNYEDLEGLLTLNQDLHRLNAAYNQIPIFLATDQEGGLVHRLPSEGVAFPGNMALGATQNIWHSYQAAMIQGAELRALGFNMTMAPVMDVNNNPENPVIGTRSYGEDPLLVSEMGVAAMMGYSATGVIPTVKHFPGHGDTAVDSHTALPTVNHDRDRLEAIELEPFALANEYGMPSLMTGHISFPALDETGNPATLSEPILTDLLRKDWGYDGLIITDDMDMKAIADNYGREEAAIMALEAGADILLYSSGPAGQESIYNAVIEAVNEGRLTEKQIDDKVRRILTTKANYQLYETPFFALEDVRDFMGASENRFAAQAIANDSITLVKNEGNILPLKHSQTEKILVIWPEEFRVSESVLAPERLQPGAARSALGLSLTMRYLNVEEMTLPRTLSETDQEQILATASEYDYIIMGGYDLQRNSDRSTLVDRLLAQDTTLIYVGLREPYDLAANSDIPVYLAAYSSNLSSMDAVSKIIVGELEPKGVLPVSIPGHPEYSFGHGLRLSGEKIEKFEE